MRTTETAKEAPQRGFGLSPSTCVVIASRGGTGILVSPGYMMASLRNYTAISESLERLRLPCARVQGRDEAVARLHQTEV